MTIIHPTAIVSNKTSIGKDVIIGPYCIVDAGVVLADRVKLHSHVVISEGTTLGEETQVWPFTCLGAIPQDLKYKGEKGKLIIGKRNIIRELSSIHIGTSEGGLITSLGDDNLIMSLVHLGHDIKIGNKVVISASTSIAGHVIIDDNAIISGKVGIVQFCHIGSFAIVGGMEKITDNIPPFAAVHGGKIKANIVGLKRHQHIFNRKDIIYIIKFYNNLSKYKSLNRLLECERDLDYLNNVFVQQIINFMKHNEN